MSSFRRTTNPAFGTDNLYYAADLHAIIDLLNGTTSGIPPVKFKSTNGVTFWDGILKFKDVTNESFELVIKNPNGLSAIRNLTLPAISVNDTLMAVNFTQTPTNKTINLSDNTVTDTSAVSGEIIAHDGTKFLRKPAGTTTQFLRGDGAWATAPGQGGGEANTASNTGTVGVGIFKQKASMDLEFYKLNALSNKLSLVLNGTDRIDLDVEESNLTLTNIGGTLSVPKGGTGATSLTGILKGNGASAITAVTAPTGDILGHTDTQTVTNKTLVAASNTITDTSAVLGDLFRFNGTRFVRFPKGTANQYLKVNTGGTDIEWGTGTSGSGMPTNGTQILGKWTKLGHNNGLGTLAGALQLNQAGTPTITGYRTATEHGISITATASNVGGGYVSQIANLYRELEFTLTVRWQLIENGSNSTELWIGVTDGLTTDMTASSFPNNKNCLLFGKRDGDTTWSTIRNDGASSITQSDTKTEDENIHKTVITGGATNMTLKHDSDSTSTYTTSIPSTTIALGIVVWMNAESSTSKTFRILDIDLQHNFKTGA